MRGRAARRAQSLYCAAWRRSLRLSLKVGAGAADWRNKATVPYRCAVVFRIVFSIPQRLDCAPAVRHANSQRMHPPPLRDRGPQLLRRGRHVDMADAVGAPERVQDGVHDRRAGADGAGSPPPSRRADWWCTAHCGSRSERPEYRRRAATHSPSGWRSRAGRKRRRRPCPPSRPARCPGPRRHAPDRPAAAG